VLVGRKKMEQLLEVARQGKEERSDESWQIGQAVWYTYVADYSPIWTVSSRPIILPPDISD
jgi:hypothetical protein